jgi:hypothetical protein
MIDISQIIKEFEALTVDELERQFQQFGLNPIRKSSTILEKLYGIENYLDALTYICNIVELELQNGNIELIDDILNKYNPEKCDIIVSTNILRCCFRIKNELPHWDSTLLNVKNHLNSLCLDVENILCCV